MEREKEGMWRRERGGREEEEEVERRRRRVVMVASCLAVQQLGLSPSPSLDLVADAVEERHSILLLVQPAKVLRHLPGTSWTQGGGGGGSGGGTHTHVKTFTHQPKKVSLQDG